MNAFDYYAVVYDGDIYCTECLPDDVDTDDTDMHGNSVCNPIFAGSEWDYVPVCAVCGEVHDYVTIIKYPPHIEEGSTSSDSCKLEDIVNGVSDLIPDELLTEFNEVTEEDQQYIFEDIFDHLNEIAPDGLMFGATDGDGACYGFWKMEDDI
jgi:hypothetical protein